MSADAERAARKGFTSLRDHNGVKLPIPIICGDQVVFGEARISQ
jgi:hypothetical protein